MKALVDTHVMLWWLGADNRLSQRVSKLIADGDNELFWSIASSWEISVKLGLGKLEIDRPVHRLFADLLGEQGLVSLAVTHDHCARLATLPQHHRDPFDRMLVVQAQVEGIPVLTADPKFSLYDVEVLW